MEQWVEREELVKKYLLGSLGEAEQAEVEDRLLTDEEYFNELGLVEGELADDFAFGNLSADEEAMARNLFLVIPEWRQNLKYAEVLGQFVAEVEPAADAEWESALAEAQENRYLLATLTDGDWAGLRLLALVKSSPRRKPDLAAGTVLDEESLTTVLVRLIECGVIEEQDGVFFCTPLGAKMLGKMERAAGVSLDL
ncbi:MAG: hypothetical protein ABW208_29340 [Pyrinomonadaceae bacterium]